MLVVILDLLWLLLLLPFSLLETLVRSTFFPRPRKSIAGELALVTGAGHGIGKEYALQLARLGAKVACWDINAKTCKETRRQIEAEGGTAWDFVCDVSNREAIARVAQQTRYKYNNLSKLYCNTV